MASPPENLLGRFIAEHQAGHLTETELFHIVSMFNEASTDNTAHGIATAIGGLMGGARRRQETNEMVTTTHTNPEYTKFEEAKSAFRNSFDTCLAQRAAQGASE